MVATIQVSRKSHRHFVFSIPKILRRYFLYDRSLLWELSRCAWETLSVFFRGAVPQRDAVPGAATSTLTYMEEHRLPDHVEKLGNYLNGKLLELKDKYKLIGEVRGKGLMLGIELVREKKEPAVAEILQLFENTKKRGLLIGKGGLHGNVVRITPPMTIEKSQIDLAVKILDQSFEEIRVP